MMAMERKWYSEAPNPDEDALRAEVEAEDKADESAYAEEAARAEAKMAEVAPLLKAANLTEADIDQKNQEAKIEGQHSLQRAQSLLSVPPMDIDELHAKDMSVTQGVARASTLKGNPSWSGFIWNASYGGWWSNWNGEGEEVPYTVINTGAERIDSRVQTWGEGWYDGDYSRAHGYLAFRFNPPSWGHLHIHVWPWLHGYWNVSSDDKWYNSSRGRVEVDTWMDVHQNFWRSRQYRRRLTVAGDDINRWGRIDRQYHHGYYTNVGANDTVTIRVGLHHYAYARSSNGRARVDFLSGSGNYVWAPYVYWYLHT